jgi:asparagine synthase (glutamine-hydrolysing)
VAVNGEIYNDAELRLELGAERFASRSDSEVALHGYLEWGLPGLLERIDGMFALAIYDRRDKRLLLARDRFGQKPIFYARVGGRFWFASEAKAILEAEPSTRRFSYAGVVDWMGRRGARSGRTLFAGIERLAPGHWLSLDARGVVTVERYYDLVSLASTAEVERQPAESIDRTLDDLLARSVRKRFASDVPVGLQLSGGVDSSILADHVYKAGRELHSFSIGFAEERFAGYSEEPWSRRVARETGCLHRAITVTADEMAAAYERCVWLSDGMLDYPNSIALHLLCRAAKDDVTVMLSGEGADELFGGYEKYRVVGALAEREPRVARWLPEASFDFSWRRGWWRESLRGLHLARRFGGRPDAIAAHMNDYVSHETLWSLFGVGPASHFPGDEALALAELPFERRLLVVDHLTYLHSLFERQDRVSMGASVETRAPFVDRELVEWAMTLHPADLYDAEETKRPLKRIAARRFGDEFASRKKVGFRVPREALMEADGWLGARAERAVAPDFVLYERADRDAVVSFLDGDGFDRRALNYADSERSWLRWYLMTLRTAQDVFGIDGVED